MSEAMTIETIIDLFADEAAEYGEPRPEALERARHALAVHDAGVRRAAVEKVLELHWDDAGTCGACSQGRATDYPCPTVQAIQEALGGVNHD